jgi:hypothetical protein
MAVPNKRVQTLCQFRVQIADRGSISSENVWLVKARHSTSLHRTMAFVSVERPRSLPS